jgi:hypothetical protein
VGHELRPWWALATACPLHPLDAGKKKGRKMAKGTWWMALVAMALACGGEPREEAATGPATAGVGDGTSMPAESDSPIGLTREVFSRCTGIEEHRAELASIVGFQHDPERSVAGVGASCFVRGRGGDFLRVALAPAMAPSVEMVAKGYDAETSPLPEVAPSAVFVDDGFQPHVVFSLDGLIIDIDAENVETPSRETMVRLANRVREILAEMTP